MDRYTDREERPGAAGGTADAAPAAAEGSVAVALGAEAAGPAEGDQLAADAARERSREIIMRRWALLTREDLDEAAGGRGALARVIARRYGISTGEAKRQVRDMGRMIRGVEGGRRSRGKRMRRTLERTGREISEVVAGGMDEVRDLFKVLGAGGLGGGSTTRLPRPKPEPPPPGQGGITAAPSPVPPTREEAEAS